MTHKRNTSGLRPFVKGQSGNPSGGVKHQLTGRKLNDLISRLTHMTRAELQKVVENPRSTMLEITVASILAKAAKDGDYSRLEQLLTRSIGKVKEQLEVSATKPYIIHKPDGGTLELGAKPVEIIEGEVED